MQIPQGGVNSYMQSQKANKASQAGKTNPMQAGQQVQGLQNNQNTNALSGSQNVQFAGVNLQQPQISGAHKLNVMG